MRNKWIKWVERKPKDGEPVIVILCDYTYGNPAYKILFMGGAILSMIDERWRRRLDEVYWIELPTKGK